MNPHGLYPDPQNLMNKDLDPDPGQLNRQIDFNPSFKSRKKNIFKSVPKP